MGKDKQIKPISASSSSVPKNGTVESNKNDKQTVKSCESSQVPGIPNPGSSSAGKSVTIETASEAECQKLIANILSKKGASGEDIIIEYKGSESLDDLIPNLFNFPTETDKEEIKKIQKQNESQLEGDTVTVKNVIISETPYEVDKDLEDVGGDVNETTNKPAQSQQSIDDMCKQLVAQLPTVEGFDTEEWGAAVDTKSDSILFFEVANSNTDEDKNGYLEELLNCSSSSDKTDILVRSETHQADISTDYPCDRDSDANNLEQLDDNDMLMDEPMDDEFGEVNGEDFSAYEGGEFDLAGFSSGVGRLPEDIITPSFVLDFVLNSTPPYPSNASGISNNLESKTEDMKQLDATTKPISVNELEGGNTGNRCDNELQQIEPDPEPQGEITEESIPQSHHVATEKIDQQVIDATSVFTGTGNPGECVISPVLNTDLKSTSTNNSPHQVKPCFISLTRIDAPPPVSTNNELNPTSSATSSADIDAATPKSTESNDTALPADKNMKLNTDPGSALALKISSRIAAWKKRRSSELQEKAIDHYNIETIDLEPEETPVSKLVNAEVAEFSSSSNSNSQSQTQCPTPLQQKPCPNSLKKQDAKPMKQENPSPKSAKTTAKIADNEQSQNTLNECVEDTTATSLSPPSDKGKTPAHPENVETPTTKNVRSSLRRKGVSEVSPGPTKRTKSAPQPSQSQKSLLNLMKKECFESNPDLLFLSDTLAKTFSARQKYMDDPDVDVAQVIDRYPALGLYPMVKVEFGRMLGDTENMLELEAKLRDNLFEALSLKKKPFRKRHPLWEEAVAYWKDNQNCDQRKKLILGMVALCFHFVDNAVVTNLLKILEKNEKLQPRDQQNLVTPRLVLNKSQLFETDTEMWIYTEARQYLRVPNIYEGVLCIYATYYVHNMQYDKKLQPLFEYFDYIIGIPQNRFTDTSDAFSVKK